MHEHDRLLAETDEANATIGNDHRFHHRRFSRVGLAVKQRERS